MSQPESGRSVGRYRILDFIGAGAMGEVYLAEDPQIERKLAIKTVRLVGRPQEVEDRKRRLLREARAAGRLLHPNIVTLFDAGEQEGLLFLAFEYVEGTDLATRLENGPPLSLREVLRILRQAAEALDFAHRQEIVHRDIKPSNILLDKAGRVKVADFGIAKMAGQSTELTVAGSVMGSPQYLSPEQIRGEELDGRSDIFSLGVVLYELLSKRRPFDGETITTLVYQILHQEPPPISDLRQVPDRLEVLLRRMLAKDRNERFAAAGEVATEIAAIERELSDETLSAPASDLPMQETRVLPRRTGEASLPAPPPAPATLPALAIPPPVPPAAAPPPNPAATAATDDRGARLIVAIAVVLAVLAVGLAAGWFFFLRKPAGPDLAEAPAQAVPDGAAPASRPGAREPASSADRSDEELEAAPGDAPITREPVLEPSPSPAPPREPARIPEAAEATPRRDAGAEPQFPGGSPQRERGPLLPRPRDRQPASPPPAAPPEPRPGGEAVEPAAPIVEPRVEAAPPAPQVDTVLKTGLELAFRTTPADAFVLVDGTNIGRAVEWSGQKGGRTYTLDGPGEYLVKIRSQGMKEHRILVQASATGGVTPVLTRLQPLGGEEAETSDLRLIRVREAIGFRVEPPGAGVLVDGQPVGLARRYPGRLGMPGSWLRLPPGRHRISVVAPGLGRQDFAVEVTAGAEKERERIEVDLKPEGSR